MRPKFCFELPQERLSFADPPGRYFPSRLLDFVDNDCAAVSPLVWSFRDRAPARIPAARKPINAANIISMTMIAADHMLISAMMDGPFIRFG
jgi:hypothetical protein